LRKNSNGDVTATRGAEEEGVGEGGGREEEEEDGFATGREAAGEETLGGVAGTVRAGRAGVTGAAREEAGASFRTGEVGGGGDRGDRAAAAEGAGGAGVTGAESESGARGVRPAAAEEAGGAGVTGSGSGMMKGGDGSDVDTPDSSSEPSERCDESEPKKASTSRNH